MELRLGNGDVEGDERYQEHGRYIGDMCEMERVWLLSLCRRDGGRES